MFKSGFSKLLLFSLLLLLISKSIQVATKAQLIWIAETNKGLREDTYPYNFFYKLGHKMYKIADTNNMDSISEIYGAGEDPMSDMSGEDFMLREEREEDGNYEDSYVEMRPTDTVGTTYHRLRFFFPAIDGSHKAGLANVVWDIKVNCGCYITYNIKYFSCDDEAQDYYDMLTDTVKVIRFTDYTDRSDITVADDVMYDMDETTSQFASANEVLDVLYEVLPCVREDYTEGDSCCLPYPCWIDMNSRQCVCALDTTTNMDFCTAAQP